MDCPPSAFHKALHSALSTDSNHKALPFIVGIDQTGQTVMKDFCTLPHLLIAGATGTGKSSLAHAILLSLIRNTKPEDLRLLLCDTKVVEFGMYRGVPHLLHPVVSDPTSIGRVVSWTCDEISHRLSLLSEAGHRSITNYNDHLLAQATPSIPDILLVVDDAAKAIDSSDIWEKLRLIAQNGRAAGVHLLLVTQTPKERNLAEIISSSIPSRAVFNILSSTEEKFLLGTGKNALLSDVGEIIFCAMPHKLKERIRCYPISDNDISTIVSEARTQFVDIAYPRATTLNPVEPTEPSDELDGDDMFPAAVDVVLETGQASVSMLQRQFKLGYARAARIIDEMEEKGIVGPFQGSKPRAILITKAQWEAMQNSDYSSYIDTLDDETLNSEAVFDEPSEIAVVPEVPPTPCTTEIPEDKEKDIPYSACPHESPINKSPNEDIPEPKQSFIRKVLSFLFGKKPIIEYDAYVDPSDTPDTTHNDLPVDGDGNVIIASPDDWAKFHQLYIPLKEIETKVAGVTFDNCDGSSRQKILSQCVPGEMIDLEYFMYHGKPAYAVYTKHGQIGNLPAEIAAAIKVIYDDYITTGEISEITGGYNGLFYGCNLSLTVYKKK